MIPEEKRIRSKQDLKQWLAVELRPYRGGLAALLPTESAMLRRHQILLRKAEYYTNVGNRLLAVFYKLRLSRLQCRQGMHIPLNVCGKGLRIVHGGPVLINSKAVVGENCVFHMSTSLVAGGTNDDAPILGDHVIVGVGAVVLGGVRVADYTAIGANAVVNKDVLEENIAVAGVPARKISNNGVKEWNKKAKNKGV